MSSHPETPIRRHVLPCGLTILVETLPWVRSVALGYSLRSGSARETADVAGASHFLEHLVFKGTRSRSTVEIAAAIDALGGDVDAFTGKEYTSFHAHVLDDQVIEALELLTEIVLHPRYTADDLEMERSVVLEEIRMVEDTPDDLVHEIFVQSFWGDHPLGRPILGTEDGIAAMSREVIDAHYAETFQPANMILCASGNVRFEELVDYVERAFPTERKPFEPRMWDPPQPHPHVVLKQKSELEQVHLSLGSRGFSQDGDERYAAALLNAILGGGMSSRLFQEIREKAGLAYSVASFHNAHLGGGYESIYAACSPDNLDRMLGLTLAELRKIRFDGVSEDELTAAKRYIKGSVLLSLESTVSRMSGIMRQEFYFGRQFTPDEIIDRIDSVTSDDVNAVARQIIDPESLSLTLLGNVDSLDVTPESLRAAVS